ncbi:hypothetical protein A5746_01880 [Mycolicibacterium conceptionense]|uniref:hypothetical protein n=1 Tax=Mycolicibacterium TaxID=1866885 RepID=UPI0007EC872A|nr:MULTISPECIES: hypothetical protein [Mycolicibacterium]OBJ95130.1 hypothetical protein A5638_21545 [Mycolicibacterium fortuitum]OBK59604.1 hypothetical protein A5654_31375 [Mycolicibacterium fortuitum]OMB95208.1 hypothetical protein A5746_01880 [Mycolicibacterium conceptionense]
MSDDQTQNRVQEILTAAVADLDPSDRAERIAWCHATGQHGVRMYPSDDDDLLDFRWGGRTLAMVHRDVLTGDGPIQREFISEDAVPDTVPAEWTDETR